MIPTTEQFVLDFIQVVRQRPSVDLVSISIEYSGAQILVNGLLDNGSTIHYAALWPWDWAPGIQACLQKLYADQCEQARAKVLEFYAGLAAENVTH